MYASVYEHANPARFACKDHQWATEEEPGDQCSFYVEAIPQGCVGESSLCCFWEILPESVSGTAFFKVGTCDQTGLCNNITIDPIPTTYTGRTTTKSCPEA
jgi:hypothetical protein